MEIAQAGMLALHQPSLDLTTAPCLLHHFKGFPFPVQVAAICLVQSLLACLHAIWLMARVRLANASEIDHVS